MRITPVQAQKVLTNNYNFKQLAFSLLTTRLKRKYLNDSSETTLITCANEMNDFLERYKVLMSEDYSFISQL